MAIRVAHSLVESLVDIEVLPRKLGKPKQSTKKLMIEWFKKFLGHRRQQEHLKREEVFQKFPSHARIPPG